MDSFPMALLVQKANLFVKIAKILRKFQQESKKKPTKSTAATAATATTAMKISRKHEFFWGIHTFVHLYMK